MARDKYISLWFLIAVVTIVYLLIAVYGAESNLEKMIAIPETPLRDIIAQQYEATKMFILLVVYVLIWTREK